MTVNKSNSLCRQQERSHHASSLFVSLQKGWGGQRQLQWEVMDWEAPVTNFLLPFQTQKKNGQLFWSFLSQTRVFMQLQMRHIHVGPKEEDFWRPVMEIVLNPTTPHEVAQEGQSPWALRKKQWHLFHQSMVLHPFFSQAPKTTPGVSSVTSCRSELTRQSLVWPQ